jgi:hypothetical protein
MYLIETLSYNNRDEASDDILIVSKYEERASLLVRSIFCQLHPMVEVIGGKRSGLDAGPVKKRKHWASIICQQWAIIGSTV